MKQYLDLLHTIQEKGFVKSDRTGTGTMSIFGHQMRFDLQEGFPLVTTKKCHLRSIIHELLWFLQGDTNIKYLNDNNVTIWDEWADVNGDLGPVYGKQWRSWPTPDGRHIDQITTVMNQLKNDPDSRRIIVSAWNVAELDKMALAPCHAFFQFYSRELSLYERGELHQLHEPKEYYQTLTEKHQEQMQDELDDMGVPRRLLSCQLYQRSADTFLGVPFNIASYALLVEMMAHQLNMMPGDFVWTGGDVHLYNNHHEQAELQMSREPLPLPRLKFKRKPDSIFDYKFEDIELVGYESHPAIKAPVAI